MKQKKQKTTIYVCELSRVDDGGQDCDLVERFEADGIVQAMQKAQKAANELNAQLKESVPATQFRVRRVAWHDQ